MSNEMNVKVESLYEAIIEEVLALMPSALQCQPQRISLLTAAGIRPAEYIIGGCVWAHGLANDADVEIRFTVRRSLRTSADVTIQLDVAERVARVSTRWASGGGTTSQALAEASFYMDLVQKGAGAELALTHLMSCFDHAEIGPALSACVKRFEAVCEQGHEVFKQARAARA